ncbi:MAG: cobalt-precorrin-7 (C(5))-methyltransferase [Haloferacaceae archaeon]
MSDAGGRDGESGAGERDPASDASPDDPATVAAAAPEPDPSTADANPVHAVGVGPGDPAHLTRRAVDLLRNADAVVGFETVVDVVRDETDAPLLACGYDDEGETLAAFADRVAGGAAGVAVLMGDPNHSGYQFLGRVEDAVDRPVRVVPGVSSLQVAASRARTPMEATTFVTLHKRGPVAADLARLAGAVGERHLLVLPRPYDWMPGDVAASLCDAGADPALDALVLERLTHPDERITRTTLGDLAAHAGGSAPEDSPFSDLSVLAVRR